jgi:hypothetical protein
LQIVYTKATNPAQNTVFTKISTDFATRTGLILSSTFVKTPDTNYPSQLYSIIIQFNKTACRENGILFTG